MLMFLISMLIVLPIIFVIGRAFYVSKDYYDYDNKKEKYISKFSK